MMDSLRLAKVAAAHPEANAVDLVFLDDGSQIPMVQVMSGFAGTNFGLAGLAEPSLPPSGDKWDLAESKDRDIMAIVGFLKRMPVVLGFLFPQIGQMTFPDVNRRIDRHPSDVYTTIDDDGNLEVYHPSGTYVRIGTAAAHEDLTGKDYDKKFKIEKNTETAVHVQLTVKNAGEQKASLNIDPSGNITLVHVGNLSTDTGGNAVAEVAGTLNATVQGDITVTTPATVTVDAPLSTFKGAVVVEGPFTYQAGMTGSGGGGASLTGPLSVVSGDITNEGKSVGSTHKHSGIQPGPSNTGNPI
jgi:hypothetical protein